MSATAPFDTLPGAIAMVTTSSSIGRHELLKAVKKKKKMGKTVFMNSTFGFPASADPSVTGPPPQDPRLPPLPKGVYYGPSENYSEYLGPCASSTTNLSTQFKDILDQQMAAKQALNEQLKSQNSANAATKTRLGSKRIWLEHLSKAKVVVPSQISKDGEYLEPERRALRDRMLDKSKYVGGTFVGNVRNRNFKTLFKTFQYHRDEDLKEEMVMEDKKQTMDKDGAPLIRLGVTSMKHRTLPWGTVGSGVDHRFLTLDQSKDIGMAWIPNPYIENHYNGHREAFHAEGKSVPLKLGAPPMTTGTFQKATLGLGCSYAHNPYAKFEPTEGKVVQHLKPFDATGRTTTRTDVKGLDGKPNLPPYVAAPYTNEEFVRSLLVVPGGVGNGFRPCERKNFKGSQAEKGWK